MEVTAEMCEWLVIVFGIRRGALCRLLPTTQVNKLIGLAGVTLTGYPDKCFKDYGQENKHYQKDERILS